MDHGEVKGHLFAAITYECNVWREVTHGKGYIMPILVMLTFLHSYFPVIHLLINFIHHLFNKWINK